MNIAGSPGSRSLFLFVLFVAVGVTCQPRSTSGPTGDMRLLSCTLGCNGGACSVTQVHENFEVVLTFSKPVDPLSVTDLAIQIQEIACSQSDPLTGGGLPSGSLVTQGNQVIYKPEITQDSTGNPIFGFLPDRCYKIQVFGALPGDSGPLFVKSTDGSLNKSSLNCTIVANQGILDKVPGKPVLIAATASDPITGQVVTGTLDGATEVSRTSNLSLVFNDLMNPAGLFNNLTGQSTLFSLEIVSLDAGGNPVGSPLPLGFWASGITDQVALTTTVTIDADLNFPGPGSSVAPRVIRLTLANGISDISGNTLDGDKVVEFSTTAHAANPLSDLNEDFSGGLQQNWTGGGQDIAYSGARWGGANVWGGTSSGASRGFVGGAGFHGELVVPANTTVTLSTHDQVTDPSSIQLFTSVDDDTPLPGQSETASGTLYGLFQVPTVPATNFGNLAGVFHLSRLEIQPGGRLRLEGPNPARVLVAGEVLIQGVLDAEGGPGIGRDAAGILKSGTDLSHDGNSLTGGAGGLGNLGGVDGGEGGGKPTNFNAFASAPPADGTIATGDGRFGDDGSDNGFAGTGGGGSKTNPESGANGDGNPQSYYWSSQIVASPHYALFHSATGGGGGMVSVGSAGGYDPNPPALLYAPLDPEQPAGGASVPLVDVSLDPDAAGTSWIGGSGGGGAGSSPFGSINTLAGPLWGSPVTAPFWHSGGGGGGGGGRLHFMVGGNFSVKGAGRLSVAGGAGGIRDASAPDQTFNSFTKSNASTAGGGGSGGSLLLQTSGTLSLGGSTSIDVAGGLAGPPPTGGPAGPVDPVNGLLGGSGAPGFLRVETPTGSESMAGFVNPPEVLLLSPLNNPAWVPVTGLDPVIKHDTLSHQFSALRSDWYVADASFPLLVLEGFEVHLVEVDNATGAESNETCYLGGGLAALGDCSTGLTPEVIQLVISSTAASPGGFFVQSARPDVGAVPVSDTPWTQDFSTLNAGFPRAVRFLFVFDHNYERSALAPLGRHQEIKFVRLPATAD